MSLSATIYQQAQARIEAKEGDDRDEVIVALWTQFHAAVNEILAQRMVISKQQASLDDAALKLAHLKFNEGVNISFAEADLILNHPVATMQH